MTYEFNSQDQHLEVPNPFKIENSFLLLAAAFLFAGGIGVAMTARGFMQAGDMKVALAAMALAMLLFTGAVKFSMLSLSQIRFFYGRQFPKGLADELQVAQTGETQSSKSLMGILRQRAIEFPEPTGPLNGVLYSLSKRLITAPPQIQAAAVQQFHSVVGMVLMLGSLCISYVIFAGSPHEGIISWMYLPLTGVSLLTPFLQLPAPDMMQRSDKMLWSLVGMVGFAIIGPALAQKYLPPFQIPPMWIAPVLVLVCSMVASSLFLGSLFSKIDDVKHTSVSCEQTTIAMNCPPSQLWTEIGRDFQNNWVRNIPNRAYANVPPDVSASERGSFAGHILEESQPTPAGNMAFSSFGEAWSTKYARFLILLSAWGALLSLLSAAVANHYAKEFADMSRMEISRVMVTVIALGVANVLAFKIGHMLWSRMYFKSRLTWIEVSGTFQTSKLSIGNRFTGKAQSSSTLTRVEDATLRVWVTDIVSVAFGKDADRSIMALAPADGIAKSMADRLIAFAANQSSIVTPTSQRDIGKAMAMNALDNAMQQNSEALTKEALKQVAGMSKTAVPVLEEGQQAGHVKFYNVDREFGFIVGDDGVERFFNGNQLGGKTVSAGDRVLFVPAKNARGPQANKVRELV